MSDAELLEELIKRYVAWARYAREYLEYENSGRFATLWDAAILVTGRDETLALRWLKRRIEELESVMYPTERSGS